jgi:hypothetical protein
MVDLIAHQAGFRTDLPPQDRLSEYHPEVWRVGSVKRFLSFHAVAHSALDIVHHSTSFEQRAGVALRLQEPWYHVGAVVPDGRGIALVLQEGAHPWAVVAVLGVFGEGC